MNASPLQATGLPLTAGQRDIWLDQLSRGDSPLYNIGGYAELRGPFRPELMQRTVELVVARHDVLRTVLSLEGSQDGLPLQYFDRHGSVELAFHDFSDETDPLAVARQHVQRQMQQAFPLEGQRLCRFSLLRLGPEHHLVEVEAHHLILDGWGFAQLSQALGEVYGALLRGEEPEATAPCFSDFIEDDARYRQSSRYQRDRDYWLDLYRTLPEPLLRPRYRPSPDAPPGESLVQAFPAVLHERMKSLGQELGGSAFHVLLAALHVYFTRVGQRAEWVLGMPVLNRPNAAFKATLGSFTQVSAVRMDFPGELTFQGLVMAVRDRLKQDFRHQRFPLSELNRALGLLREDRTQLFELSLSYEVENLDYHYGEAGASSVKVSNHHEPAPLAIHLRSNRFEDSAWMHFVYDRSYFRDEDIQALSAHLLHVLQQGLEDVALPIRRFSLLTDGERARLQQWNATDRAPSAERLIHARIEAWAEHTPEAIALVAQGRTLSYAQLNQRANTLARHLLTLGVSPDDRVAMVARRSPETLVGLLAILKAGAGYVPIDPAHPAERLAYLLEDCAPVAVLTQGSLAEGLPPLSVPVLSVDSEQWRQGSPRNLQVPGLTPQHLAYVIYTSGSTGLPKGVLVEHRSLSGLVDWHCQAFDLRPGSQASCLAGFGFDAMAWEVWPTLCAGATLHLAPVSEGPENLDALLAWWRTQPLDLSFLPTPVAEYAFSQQSGHPTLRTLLVGGDRLRQAPGEQGFVLVNNYGPTEATVVATSGVIEVDAPLHIGRPIANARIYLLDEQQQPLPIGVPGELYVGGAGVARGYLNRPQLTAERFLDDPFSDQPGARMYRTGDLARWQRDGTLEYLGRNDDQVKIRGLRIELGEVETCLGCHPLLQEAVVQARDGQLVAWFTAREPVAIGQLREYLLQHLPDYMVPMAYVQLEALPLTANGKLDRQALPGPGPQALISREYEAPCGPLETTLARLWSEVLHVPQVGRHDHFFELGGHSLLALQLIQRMGQEGLHADVQVLFGQPTLVSLAAAVDDRPAWQVPANRVPSGCQRITPSMLSLLDLDQDSIDRVVATVPGGSANVQEIYPLAPLQAGLLYHHMTFAARDPYQQHALFAFARREDLEAFAQALQAVIQRHDILRTSLVWEVVEPAVQVVWREARLTVQELQPQPGGIAVAEQLIEHFDPRHRPLDIRQAPMLALAWAEDRQNQRWVAMLRFHHLVNDATSTVTLMTEIGAHMAGHQGQLAAPFAYREYVARTGLQQQEHAAFFRQGLAAVDAPTLAFELKERPGEQSAPDEVRQLLDEDLARRLRSAVRRQGVSAASLFHLAWALVLGRSSGRDDVLFGTVLLGRLQAGAGADRALGMFINTLPLRLELAGLGVADGLRQVQARLSALLAHEQAPLSLAQRCSAVAPPTPLFNALLNYRHNVGADAQALLQDLPGVELLSCEEVVSYPLMLAVDDLEPGFRLGVRAPRQIGAQRVLDYLVCALEGLLQALAQAPQTPLHSLSILPPAEAAQLLLEYNATESDYPRESTLHALFEAQVRRTPQAIALQAGEQCLSYAQLNHEANQLAHHLRELGVGPDVRVGLCVERGPQLLVGLLGILKAGGAYVPLDPDYPAERLRFLVQDSQPRVLLVQQSTRHLLQGPGLALLDFDHAAWHHQPGHDPQVPGLNVSHLAYVIYTSGSTGTPKGVMVEHRGLGNLMHWGSQLCPQSGGGTLLQKAPFSFDGSVWELFWPLVTGMRLLLARPGGQREPTYLAQLVVEQQVTMVKFVPAMLLQFLQLEESGQCQSLTDVFCGGGELTEAIARLFRQRLPRARLHNVYGPTEATVDSTAWTLEPGAAIPAVQLPIGRAITNTRLYVLDTHDQPVPRGVSGQLHIGGVGVARGYLGLAQLQAERFIDSPFVAGDRLYRTGDLVRYGDDGNLEFLGRNDFQIKLRGLRLEPGEIEARLASHPAVREVAVLMRSERLVAYYSLHPGASAPGVEGLRAHVLERLPEYMVPAAYVLLAELPLSSNGKLDRKALPEPGAEAVLARAFEAPVGELETTLARLWAEVLQVERVGRHDHFFELGGHSLLAVSLVARMRQEGLHADARLLFSQPTLAALAANTRSHSQSVDIPATTIPQLKRQRRL
ncbi:non-ribosomal peptide synthetase [Pseudomonas sessilinigenes]|uniref:Amino acid adenylation domain-containing protein n=1 Tax=Pseudomonas sessilinigenes TaxID=658629 RepID=I0CEU6_9PSED|nr:non-ribosomal peptide synthetase [Pseudomonas sessilinigenes]AFH75328.1 nonribosomal peptide synthetase [Pseudomonas sessilinigenes]AZC23857.1 Peptide synthetase [Pseudomonas sessilinigenes]QXH42837.1 amino acid adenylation domain-containing protein [Pseudomonas sessilinigenes]